MVLQVLLTGDCARPLDDGEAAGCMHWGHADVLDLARDVPAQDRSLAHTVLPVVSMRRWSMSEVHTFAMTSLRCLPRACPARFGPRDLVVAETSSRSSVLPR